MTALICYIYPNSTKYFGEFCASVLAQTDADFEVVFFNDGVDESLFENLSFPNRVIPISGNPLEIRFRSFEIMKSLPYDQFVFLDSDDCMTANRMEVMKQKLKLFPLVCNDLNLMDDGGKIFETAIWRERMPEDFQFDYHFIQDKNVVGLGNSGLRKELLNCELIVNNEAKIADWFLFYQLLKNTGVNCIFTSECQTNYRQYDANDAGIREITEDRLAHTLRITNQQYKALRESGIEQFEPVSIDFKSGFVNETHRFPFWWEEIKIINENKIIQHHEIN